MFKTISYIGITIIDIYTTDGVKRLDCFDNYLESSYCWKEIRAFSSWFDAYYEVRIVRNISNWNLDTLDIFFFFGNNISNCSQKYVYFYCKSLDIQYIQNFLRRFWTLFVSPTLFQSLTWCIFFSNLTDWTTPSM